MLITKFENGSTYYATAISTPTSQHKLKYSFKDCPTLVFYFLLYRALGNCERKKYENMGGTTSCYNRSFLQPFADMMREGAKVENGP